MKTTQTRPTPNGAGGLDTREPQDPANASVAENLTVDARTGGFSTRLGYEKYRPDPTDGFVPFQSTTFVYSIHAAQDLARGARESIIFEEGGNLHLFYQSGQQRLIRTLADGRHVPAPTEASSWYTATPHGTLITNGHDWPVLVYPWPLGDASESSGAIESCIRDFGFRSQPQAPQPYVVAPLASPTTSGTTVGTHLWYPKAPDAVDPVVTPGGRWGMGFSLGSGTNIGATINIAVSYVTDTGSEGPLSDIGSVSWELPSGAAGFWYAFASSIPTGPAGTAARKIYRTKNLHEDSPDAGDDQLYFTTLIRNNSDLLHIEAVRPVNLISPASVVPTGIMPAPRARFSAYWEGRIWLDGGPDDPTSVYYSEENLIEQFPVINAFSLTGEGGGVTGMFAHAGALFIFREGSIDAAIRREDGGFSILTVVPGIGTLAPHSIAAVPGLGLVFLSRDGVYALTGTMTSSGSTVEAVLLSGTIREDLQVRLTSGCEARSWGVYWPQQREYILWAPVDGYDRPNMGYVLHLDKTKQLDVATWSLRPPKPDSGLADWPVGSICVDASGTPVFGHNRGFEASVGNAPVEAGLFVLSGRRALGGEIVEDLFVYGDAPVSKYKTAWWDGGEAATLKAVQYVVVHLMTTGDPTLTVRHFRDGGLTPVEERTYKCQPPTAEDVPVLGTVTMDSGALWTRERLVPIRVGVAPGKAFSFCWEFETDEDVIFVGWELGFASDGTQVIAGKVSP